MLGDALLVAPVLEPGARLWSVYLPDGDWVEASTGKPFQGGRLIDVDVRERTAVPLFVAAERWESLRPVLVG
ncbi:TIM-barrel domain-containing protein [Arenivirga flava]|nr:TIM-barrel domain-containing protein [Arenivirga flava]